MTDRDRIQITTYSKDRQVSTTNTGIEIRHEGKPVKGTSSSREMSAPAGTTGVVLLLMDCSLSMEGVKLQKAKQGALSFSRDAIEKGYFVGLIKFDSRAKLITEATKDLALLKVGLGTLRTNPSTNMEEAIYVGTNLLKGLPGQRILVLVTDGMPTGRDEPRASLKAGEFAKSNKIDIMAIGTDDANQDFLRALASRSELAMKVTTEKFEQTIATSFKLLPGGSVIKKY